ncbi:hypothetical protein [Nitrospirillum sp. BR 11163]|uniref:hypothetical protein n=1 Tax=Nitrospirillum sp. BR 11163 TaxID=3104323 RepID=UPI002AFF5343|nr:hypothetical protein [Nitrospirillum sp. BR 11163]MEA1676304.1 hypothetical protein [Nitrospirillum sp. BR 11163]
MTLPPSVDRLVSPVETDTKQLDSTTPFTAMFSAIAGFIAGNARTKARNAGRMKPLTARMERRHPFLKVLARHPPWVPLSGISQQSNIHAVNLAAV